MAVVVSSNWENLTIYYANLSPIYFCSSLFTILALLLTWWVAHKSSNCKDPDQIKEDDGFHQNHKSTISKKYERRALSRKKNITESHSDEDSDSPLNTNRVTSEKFNTTNSVMKQIKSARQSEIEKQLTAGLTEEQKKHELETQAAQLEAIYKLLKDKEDQFQIGSMDELQAQMKLYRT